MLRVLTTTVMDILLLGAFVGSRMQQMSIIQVHILLDYIIDYLHMYDRTMLNNI